jgi:hypothetical protein
MSKYTPYLLLILATLIASATEIPIQRLGGNRICIIQSGITSTGVTAYVIVPASAPATFRHPVQVSLDVEEERACFTITPELDQAIGKATNTSYLVIPELSLAESPLRDLMLPMVRHVTLSFPEDSVVRGAKLALTKVYVPPSEAKAIGDKANWNITAAGKTLDVDRISVDDDAVVIVLREPPGNGLKLDVVYKKDQPVEFATSLKTLGVPKFTKDDPVGDSNLYLGLAFARSKFSEKRPSDTYGLRIHSGFTVRLPSRGNHLLSLDPALNLLANAPNQADDENSASIAAPLTWQILPGRKGNDRPPRYAERIIVRGAPGFEATKDFRSTNFVFQAEGHVVPQIWIKKLPVNRVFNSVRFDFDPQVGWEGGKNIHSPVAALNAQSLNRFKAGGLTKLTFVANKNQVVKAIVFQVNYTYRYLFKPELIPSVSTIEFGPGILTPNDGSSPIVLPGGSVEAPGTKLFDTGPRRYADVSLRFVINRNWEFFTAFTRGELPPIYKHVDKLQTGVAFRLSLGDQ